MQPTRVLIVDDERGLRVTMTEFLRAEGYEVDAAEDVPTAERLLDRRAHHVVVADIILPGDDGLALLKWAGDRHPDTAVIMMTGEPSYETAAEAVRAGAFDYLPKPLSRDTICAIVAKAARLAILQRENRSYREDLEGLVRVRTAELEAVNLRLEALLESQRRAEDALRESERKYRLLAENVTDVIWMCDLSLRFTYVSPSSTRLFGLSPEQYVEAPLSALLPPESEARVHEILRAEIEADAAGTTDPFRARTVELDHLRADGSTVPIEVTAAFVREGEGPPLGMLGVTRDISERRAAEAERRTLEEALRRSQRLEAMGRLAGGVAHDFNNLLSAILGYATFIREGLRSVDPIRSDVVEIERAALRAASMTRKLLAFSRRDVIQPEVVDVNEVLDLCEDRMRRLLAGDVGLVLRLAPDLPPVRMDRSHLEQVVQNLATNAREAMPRGGELVIETSFVDAGLGGFPTSSAAAPGQYVRLAFSDTGVGMPKEVLEHACEPFVTTKTESENEGRGLGLSSVYGMVMQAGGDLSIRSEEGAGTSVDVLIPVAGPERDVPRAARPANEGARPCETILVVEDDPAVLRLSCRILESSGYVVVPASSGADALRAAESRSGRIDLLLADVIMPGMSGGELAARLMEGTPSLRVLFMSGYADDVIARHGVLSDETLVLQKPFTMEQLVEAVDAAILGVPLAGSG